MGEMKLKLNSVLLIGLFVFTLLVLGFVLRNFPFSKGNFDNNYPPIITATDVTFFTWHTKSAADTEMPVIEPSYTTGGVQNVMGTYPPLMYIFTGSLSKLTNVSPYQMAFILICILTILASLYGFVIVRRYFGTEPALFALILALFPSTTILFPVYIGFWADIFSFAPAIAALFFIRELWSKEGILPLAIFAALSASALIGHAFEFMYCLYIFSFFVLSISFLYITTRKLEKQAIINLGITLVLLLIFALSFLLKFNVFAYDTGNTFKLGTVRPGPPSYFPLITEKIPFILGALFLIGTLIGIFFIVMMALQKKLSVPKLAVICLPVFVVGIVLGRYIGIENMQTYRQLYHSYYFLLLPFSIGLAGMINQFKNRLPQPKILFIGMLVLILGVSYLVSASTYNELAMNTKGVVFQMSEWNSLAWIRDNTSPDSKILILFGLYGQGFDLYSERMSTWYPHDETYLAKICNKTLPEYYNSTFRLYLFSRDGQFKILNKDGSTGFLRHDITFQYSLKRIEEFDYVLLRYRGTQIDPCMQFYITEMQKLGHSVAWYDDSVAVIKVTKNVTRTNN